MNIILEEVGILISSRIILEKSELATRFARPELVQGEVSPHESGADTSRISWREELHLRPAHYECAALLAELRQHYFRFERAEK